METIFPMEPIGLTEQLIYQQPRQMQVVDTSNLGGVYNTSTGLQNNGGLWDSLSSPGFWQGAGDAMSGLGALGNIWLGSQSLGLLEDQLAMQQDAWNEQKAELNRLRRVRDKVNTSYMA